MVTLHHAKIQHNNHGVVAESLSSLIWIKGERTEISDNMGKGVYAANHAEILLGYGIEAINNGTSLSGGGIWRRNSFNYETFNGGWIRQQKSLKNEHNESHVILSSD